MDLRDILRSILCESGVRHARMKNLSSKYCDFSYNLLYFVLTYCLPLVIMLLAYLQMGRKLWCQKNIGEDTPTLAKCRKTKQKVG